MSEDLLCLIRYDDFYLLQFCLTNSPVFSNGFGESYPIAFEITDRNALPSSFQFAILIELFNYLGPKIKNRSGREATNVQYARSQPITRLDVWG